MSNVFEGSQAQLVERFVSINGMKWPADVDKPGDWSDDGDNRRIFVRTAQELRRMIGPQLADAAYQKAQGVEPSLPQMADKLANLNTEQPAAKPKAKAKAKAKGKTKASQADIDAAAKVGEQMNEEAPADDGSGSEQD